MKLTETESMLFEIEMQNCHEFEAGVVRDSIEHLGYDWTERYGRTKNLYFCENGEPVSAFMLAKRGSTKWVYTTFRGCTCPEFYFKSREFGDNYRCPHMKALADRTFHLNHDEPEKAVTGKLPKSVPDSAQPNIPKSTATWQYWQREVERLRKQKRQKKTIKIYRELNHAENELRKALKADGATIPSKSAPVKGSVENGRKSKGFNQPD